MSAMIVSLDRPTGGNQSFNRAGVLPDMFTHTMRNLDHATRGPKAIPPGARYPHSICARKSKLAGRYHNATQLLNTRSRNRRIANNLNSVAHGTHQGVWPIAWIISSPAWTYSSCDRRSRDLASNS